MEKVLNCARGTVGRLAVVVTTLRCALLSSYLLSRAKELCVLAMLDSKKHNLAAAPKRWTKLVCSHLQSKTSPVSYY